MRVKYSLTIVFITILSTLLPITGSAQWELREIITNDNITYPETSKLAGVSNTIGITQIEIKYHRPAVRNRTVFGALIPYGKVWRAGANESTTITFQDDVSINGNPLKSGIYGLHMIPGKEEWIIIFSKNHTQWGSFYYDKKEDALRIAAKPKKIEHQEFLKYDFEDIQDNRVTIVLKWDQIQISFNVTVDEVATTLAVVEDELRTLPRFSWRGNREAAFYLWLHNVHLNKALELINRSISYERRFETIYQKALILASMGKLSQSEKLMGEALELGNERKFLYVGREAIGHHNSPEKAMELFENTLRYFPNSYQAKMLIGRTYAAMGKTGLANRTLNEALILAKTEKEKEVVKSEMRIYGIKFQ